MAEAFARHEFAARGLGVTVASCGLLEGGRPPVAEVIDLMHERGIDVTGHRSQTISPSLIAEAALIVGMERRHIEAIIGITPGAFARSFTLPELVRRIESLPENEGRPRTLDESLAEIAETRTNRDLLRITVADEIPDPIGRSGRTFDHVANRIDELLTRFIAAQWPIDEVSAAASGGER